MRTVEHARAVVAAAELQRNVRASPADELCLGPLQQGVAQALAARGRQHEELVDLGRDAEVLEAEDVDGEQVADGLAARESDPAAGELRVRTGALELAPDAGRIEIRDVLEQPILLDERQQRRNLHRREWPDVGAHGAPSRR